MLKRRISALASATSSVFSLTAVLCSLISFIRSYLLVGNGISFLIYIWGHC